jgi:predicted nucleic acid-binding protein
VSASSPARAARERERGLVDTNIVIHWERLDPSELPAEVAVSAVTVAELAAGVHAARTAQARAVRLDVLQRIESAYDPIAFDVAAARFYGRIAAAVRAAGRSPRARVADQMIAETAAAQGLPVYTTNIDDLAHLDGIVAVVAVTRP